MAETTDLQRLIVSMEANLKAYERSLNKALGITNARTKSIENRFKRMESTISRVGARLGAVTGGAVSLRGAQQLIDASTRITNALRVAGLEGEALTRVYDRLFQSAQNNAAPLESLVTLYGRAAIVQKELGVSSEELLNFTNNVAVALRVAGTDAQSASGALLQLSQALGSGTVRAEEFNSILEGALPVAQAAAAGLEEAGGSVAKLRGLVIEGKVSSEAFFRAFEAGAVVLQDKVANSQITVAQGFTRIYNAAIDAAGKINEGAQAGDKLAASLNSLAEAIATADFGPFITGLVETIQFAKELGGWLDSINATVQSWGSALGSIGRVGGGLVERVEAFTPSRGGPSSRGGPRGSSSSAAIDTVSLGDFAAPVGTGKKGRETAYQRETRQIQEATEALRLELSLIGQTEMARDKARAALELENAARRDGITNIEAHRGEIDKLASAYAEAAEAARRGQEIDQFWNDAAGAIADFAGSAITDFDNIGSALENLKNQLIDLVVQMAVVNPLKQGLSSLFGGFAGGGGGGLPKFHTGGVVPGPSGKEVPIMALGGERILPRGAANGGGAVVNVYNNVGGQVRTEQRQTQRGPEIDVYIEKKVNEAIAGGRTDSSMRFRYGQRPRTV